MSIRREHFMCENFRREYFMRENFRREYFMRENFRREIRSEKVGQNAPFYTTVPSLIFSPIKQPYSKVGISRMYRYGNAVFTLNFSWKLKNKKMRYQFRVTKEF